MKTTDSKAGYFRRFQTFVINRMGPPSTVEKDSLLYWRARILFAILFTGFLLAFFLVIPIIPFVIKEKLWGLAIMDGAACVIVVSLVLCRLRYEIRAVITLLLAYAIGVGVILSVGPMSGGPAWLFAFAVLTGVLLGSKYAIVALSINAITLTIMAWLITTGRFGQTFPFFYTSEAMIIAIANFMFLNAVAAISVTVLVKGLVSIHQKEKDLSSTLEIERSHLMKAKQELEIEIEEHKQAEQALQASEEKYRFLVENANDAIFVAQDGVIRFPNAKTEELTGYSAEELNKIPFANLIHPEDRDLVVENHKKRLKGGELPSAYSFRIINRDNEEFWVELNAALIIWEGRPATLNFLRDITPQRKIEAQLQQSQKMEAIATLAGGVAHEFNNALMGIMGNIELLKMDLPEDEGRDKYFDPMKSSGHRMSRLTDQLLAYAQGGKYQPKHLKLDDFMIQTLPILQHDLSPAVRVETHFEKDIPYIKADYAQMQMVLSAILANSNEAIEDKGLIKVTAGNEDLDEDFTKQYPGLKTGPYVCLTIEDDGKGMDEETRTGIFEPFFTTKFHGRGMGMAAVYGIVMNHDGWIYVDSELGKGTTVRIYLPVSEIEAEKPKKAKVEVVRGSGTILMIEDEDVVIKVTQTILERLGYRVMVAKTGKDAIHIAETFDGRIDLALLDIKLPDMEGGKVYPFIMKARPNLKVIVFSGYSIEGPARKILDAGAQDFIQKPFSIATLSEKLKEVLKGK